MRRTTLALNLALLSSPAFADDQEDKPKGEIVCLQMEDESKRTKCFAELHTDLSQAQAETKGFIRSAGGNFLAKDRETPCFTIPPEEWEIQNCPTEEEQKAMKAEEEKKCGVGHPMGCTCECCSQKEELPVPKG